MGKDSKLRRERAAARDLAMRKLEVTLGLYEEQAPGVIYKHYSSDCCLSATRITIEVMAAFGVVARPMVVSTMVMNPKMFQLARLKGDLPDTKEELDAWVAEGAWALGSDGRRTSMEPVGPNAWAWHLVALVGDSHLIDASSRQMNREARDIFVGDIVIGPQPAQFATGQVPAVLQCENGTILSYRAEPDVDEYKKMQGYTAGHTLVAATEIIYKMHDALRIRAGVRDPNSLV